MMIILFVILLSTTCCARSSDVLWQISSVDFMPDNTPPMIFDEYSFPEASGGLTEEQRENMIRLLMWKEWWKPFCGFPPLWEIPDCIPPDVEKEIRARGGVDSSEYWNHQYAHYKKEVRVVEKMLVRMAANEGSTIMPGTAQHFMMHHYPGFPGNADKQAPVCDSSRRPAYYGYNYSVLGQLSLFSKEFQAPSRMKVLDSRDFKDVKQARKPYQFAPYRQDQSKMVAWELPSSCFCNQYFWNGCLH
jgi:hypothetical protein